MEFLLRSGDRHCFILENAWIAKFNTVEPPLTATSLLYNGHFFFVPADKSSIHWLLFKTSLLLQRPLSSVSKVADSSSFKLHINFCCLIAKNFIWICRSKECFPIHNNFLFYPRYKYQLENKTPSNTKKWKPFFSSWVLSPNSKNIVISAPWIFILLSPQRKQKRKKCRN